MQYFLDFEQAIAVIEGKIKELRHITDDGNLNILEEISRLQSQAEKILEKTYSKLTPWQRVQVARHPDRPHCIDFIDNAAPPLPSPSTLVKIDEVIETES